jgi:hypothetical protein
VGAAAEDEEGGEEEMARGEWPNEVASTEASKTVEKAAFPVEFKEA